MARLDRLNSNGSPISNSLSGSNPQRKSKEREARSYPGPESSHGEALEHRPLSIRGSTTRSETQPHEHGIGGNSPATLHGGEDLRENMKSKSRVTQDDSSHGDANDTWSTPWHGSSRPRAYEYTPWSPEGTDSSVPRIYPGSLNVPWLLEEPPNRSDSSRLRSRSRRHHLSHPDSSRFLSMGLTEELSGLDLSSSSSHAESKPVAAAMAYGKDLARKVTTRSAFKPSPLSFVLTAITHQGCWLIRFEKATSWHKTR
jgi:hypothetical protein